MIDLNELKDALAQIEQEKVDAQTALQLQLKTESDSRRVTALSYISTLPLTIDDKKTTAEQKTQCYILMDLCKQEASKSNYQELKDELYNKINELLIQANILKDQQRVEKV